LALALSGKKVDFSSVLKMINNMVALLDQEQADDDAKKEYCGKEFDMAEDKQKTLSQSIADSDSAIADMESSIATLTDEIKALTDGINDLDKSVAEATKMRKTEHADFKDRRAAAATAKEVLLWARNRLNKFYNRKLYKEAPERQLSEGDQIAANMGVSDTTPAPGGIAGTGIGASFLQTGAVAPYRKKTEASAGVQEMINLLVKDLDKELTVSETTEKESQREYEAMMSEAASKRAEDAKSMTDKASAKAQEEESLQAEQSDRKSSSNELAATDEYIHTLHGSCDWLVKYYDTRKAARAEEVDALGRAKAVLSGADYSLVQTGRSHHKTFLRQRKLN